MPQQFPTIRVTEHARTLLRDLEQSFCTFAAVEPDDRPAVLDAYAALSERRKEFYQYIERLEKAAGFERTVVVRFD